MRTVARRVGVLLGALVLLACALWGVATYARSHQDPPAGATLVTAPLPAPGAYLTGGDA